MDEIIGYKLFRTGRDGSLHPLFINRNAVIHMGEWLPAESHPTPGFAFRPGWHACFQPVAPHLKMNLASGERRVWCRVALRGTTKYDRPESQGGSWVLAKELKVLEVL